MRCLSAFHELFPTEENREREIEKVGGGGERGGEGKEGGRGGEGERERKRERERERERES